MTQTGIPRIQVDSSAILSAGYDSATNTLEVEFPNGYIYRYFLVDSADYELMMNSKSVGRYFNTFIKGKHESICVSYLGTPYPYGGCPEAPNDGQENA